MKLKSILLLTLVFGLAAGMIAPAQALAGSTAALPWKATRIDNDMPSVLNLSSAFVGANQVPVLSWGQATEDRIYWSRYKGGGTGNCMGSNDWFCNYVNPVDLVDGTISNLVSHQYANSFTYRWVYQSGSTLRGYTFDLDANFNFTAATDNANLVNLSVFGSGTQLVGAPSLVDDMAERYRAAFTVHRLSGDIHEYRLVHLYYTGTNNTTCTTSPSLYQCDVIAFTTAEIGPPSLSVSGDGAVGIAYMSNNDLFFAYPYVSSNILRASNCGPENKDGIKTYRCITIDSLGITRPAVKQAAGSSNNDRAIVYSYSASGSDFVYRATYVGSDGDCGSDGLTVSLNPIKRWKCADVDALNVDLNKTTYSVAYTPDNFPVIAWNNNRNDGAQRLWITYPKTRIDPSYTGWAYELVDGNTWSDTGKESAIAISRSGRGFIAYMQPYYRACGDISPACALDPTPNLKTALQWFMTGLPLISR